MIKIRAFTHPAGRELNEDLFLIYDKQNKLIGTNHSEACIVATDDTSPLIACVADGVGGHAFGGAAAEIICDYILQHRLEDFESSFTEIVEGANDELCTLAEHGYTTFTGIVIDSDKANFIHCGDSRLYLIHEGQVIQLTRDDSSASALMSIFHMSAKEAHQRGRLTQCLGLNSLNLKSHKVPVISESCFILASDGAYCILDDHWHDILESDNISGCIVETLKSHLSSDEADDNMTVVILSPEASK